MALGTWGEWVGAVVTAIATVVALYLGTRSSELVADRGRARTEIRALATDDARIFDRLEAAIDDGALRDPQQATLADDLRTSRYVAAALRLGWLRQAIVLRIVRFIYGREAVRLAKLDPMDEGGQSSFGRLLAEAALGTDGERYTHRITSRLHLALLRDATPEVRHEVRRAFRTLTRI